MKISLTVKIISSKENKIIGWAGNVLILGFCGEQNIENISLHISNLLSIPKEKVSFESKKKNIYYFLIDVKYKENLEIILS